MNNISLTGDMENSLKRIEYKRDIKWDFMSHSLKERPRKKLEYFLCSLRFIAVDAGMIFNSIEK